MIVVDSKFRQMWDDGVSSREMARRLGCTYPTINRAAKAAGLPARGVDRARPGRDADMDVLHWLDLRRGGKTWRQIAILTNRDEGTVRGACHAVRSADLAESGEPAGRVEGCYW